MDRNRCENCDKVLFESRFPTTQVYCTATKNGKRKLTSLGPRVEFTMKSPKWCPRSGEQLQLWTCPRCGVEHRFWSEKNIPDYCPNCGWEPKRGGE